MKEFFLFILVVSTPAIIIEVVNRLIISELRRELKQVKRDNKELKSSLDVPNITTTQIKISMQWLHDHGYTPTKLFIDNVLYTQLRRAAILYNHWEHPMDIDINHMETIDTIMGLKVIVKEDMCGWSVECSPTHSNSTYYDEDF